jgi:hypothetical protein
MNVVWNITPTGPSEMKQRESQLKVLQSITTKFDTSIKKDQGNPFVLKITSRNHPFLPGLMKRFHPLQWNTFPILLDLKYLCSAL